jgi:hypothetical protein
LPANRLGGEDVIGAPWRRQVAHVAFFLIVQQSMNAGEETKFEGRALVPRDESFR